MTDFVLPPIVVDYDVNWIDVDLHGDLGDWARETARDILSRVPGEHTQRDEKQMVLVLEGAGAIARKPQDAAIALLLIPDATDKIRAAVRFCPVDMAGRDKDAAWAELLRALSTDDAPDVTEIPTPAGPCRRIRARYAASEGPGPPEGEHVNYVWFLPRWGAAVIMSATFEDLTEAARWRPAVDKLAAGVGLDLDPGPAPPAAS